jgi:hypothetical protein
MRSISPGYYCPEILRLRKELSLIRSPDDPKALRRNRHSPHVIGCRKDGHAALASHVSRVCVIGNRANANAAGTSACSRLRRRHERDGRLPRRHGLPAPCGSKRFNVCRPGRKSKHYIRRGLGPTTEAKSRFLDGFIIRNRVSARCRMHPPPLVHRCLSGHEGYRQTPAGAAQRILLMSYRTLGVPLGVRVVIDGSIPWWRIG